jgi:hypothetical protein
MDLAGATATVYYATPAGYPQVTDAGDHHAAPILISGATGSVQLTFNATLEAGEPALADADADGRTLWLLYTAPDTPGDLTLPVGADHYVEVYATTDPAAGFDAMDPLDLWHDPTGAQRPEGSPPVYAVRAGTVHLPTSPGGQYYLRVYPTFWGAATTLSWEVTPRVAPLVVEVGGPLDATPGQLDVTVTNVEPAAEVTFAVGAGVLATEPADASGVLRTSVPVDIELVAGTHVLTVSTAAGSATADFTVTNDPAAHPAPLPEAVGLPPEAVGGVSWQVVDPLDDSRWDFPYNPTEATSPYPGGVFTLQATTYAGGQALTWEGATRAHEWSIRGYLDTAAAYTQFERYVTSERRYWLLDHHRRWRLVSFESFDPKYRRSVLNGALNDWSFTYEVRMLVYRWGEA